MFTGGIFSAEYVGLYTKYHITYLDITGKQSKTCISVVVSVTRLKRKEKKYAAGPSIKDGTM